MRVLWLTNASILQGDIDRTGSWLSPLAKTLKTHGIEIAGIRQGRVSYVVREEKHGVVEWTVPPVRTIHRIRRQIPQQVVIAVQQIIDDFRPDVLHIWGTEGAWGLLTARNQLTGKFVTLLEMQGLMKVIARVYMGGLSISERLEATKLREFMRGHGIILNQALFVNWGYAEEEILQAHRDIAVQTQWLQAQVAAIQPTARWYTNELMLRSAFTEAKPWEWTERQEFLFVSSFPVPPYKGLHLALRALALVKRRYPNVRLRIAGGKLTGQDGYQQWLAKEIKKLGIGDNLIWLGALKSHELVQELQHTGGLILPSYVEAYSVLMREAMYIGTPIIVSYAGALPLSAKHEESALFFPMGDVESCAAQMLRLLESETLSKSLSAHALVVAQARNAPDKILQQQLSNYSQVIEVNS